MLSKGQSLRTTVLKPTVNPLKRWIFTVVYFFWRAHVHFTRVNEMETVKGMSLVYVKVEPPSTFTFTCDFS